MKKIFYTIFILIIIAATFFFLSGRTASEDVKTNINVENNVAASANESNEINEVQFIGKWVSVDDNKYEVSHGENAFLEEYYDGEVVSIGSWSIAETLPEKISEQYPNATDGPFLIKESDGEVMFYIVESVTDTNLTLIYLDRGNTLEFVRNTDN
ncbi:hypothetical protein ACFLY0_01635 [Patescibacteria group bacterium]